MTNQGSHCQQQLQGGAQMREICKNSRWRSWTFRFSDSPSHTDSHASSPSTHTQTFEEKITKIQRDEQELTQTSFRTKLYTHEPNEPAEPGREVVRCCICCARFQTKPVQMINVAALDHAIKFNTPHTEGAGVRLIHKFARSERVRSFAPFTPT